MSKTPEYKSKGFNMANSRPAPLSGEPPAQEPPRRKRDGALLAIPGVDFLTKEDTYGPYNSFDVPDQEYGAGCRTGLTCAWQLMKAIAESTSDPEDDFEGYVSDALEAASVASNQGKDSAYSRRGAGVGFLHTMSSLLVAFAKTDLWQPILDDQLRQEEKSAIEDLQDLLKQTDDFRASMGCPRRFDGTEGDSDDVGVTVAPRAPKPVPASRGKSAVAA